VEKGPPSPSVHTPRSSLDQVVKVLKCSGVTTPSKSLKRQATALTICDANTGVVYTKPDYKLLGVIEDVSRAQYSNNLLAVKNRHTGHS